MKNLKEHKQAIATDIEILCAFSIIALMSDFLWLIYDVIGKGLTVTYCVVGLGLLLGIIGTGYILLKNHIIMINKLLHIKLKEKVKHQKAVNRHNKLVNKCSKVNKINKLD